MTHRVVQRHLALAVSRFNVACRPKADRPLRRPALWIILTSALAVTDHASPFVYLDPATFRYPSTSRPRPGRDLRPGNAHGVSSPFAVLRLPAAFGMSPSRHPHMPFTATIASTSVSFFAEGSTSHSLSEPAGQSRSCSPASGFSHRGQSVPDRRVVVSGRDCPGLCPLAGLRDRSTSPGTSSCQRREPRRPALESRIDHRCRTILTSIRS